MRTEYYLELGARTLDVAAITPQEPAVVVPGGRDPSLAQLLSVIGSRVREARKDLGLSQTEVARSAGLDRAYLSSIEHGKQNVTVAALLRLANALGTGIDSLLKR